MIRLIFHTGNARIDGVFGMFCHIENEVINRNDKPI